MKELGITNQKNQIINFSNLKDLRLPNFNLRKNMRSTKISEGDPLSKMKAKQGEDEIDGDALLIRRAAPQPRHPELFENSNSLSNDDSPSSRTQQGSVICGVYVKGSDRI